MKKKLLALCLSATMILSLTTPVALAEEPEGESCGSCGQVECVCPPEEAPCEVCGEIECVCEEIEELPEEEVPGAAAPEIPEEPTACEKCGEIECVCEDAEEPEVPEVPEEPTNDYAELYEALMACESIEEFDAILGEMTEEEVLAFAESLTEEEFAALDEVLTELEEEAEQEEIEEEIEEEDTREIVYHEPTVDFTDAAPFKDPAKGVAKRMMMFAAPRAAAEEADNGLETSKRVDPVEGGQEGEYVLTLEAWATGMTTLKPGKPIPTDIVLVIDQSGSMSYDFTSVEYKATTERDPATLASKEKDLYVKRSDGSYAPVTVKNTNVPSGYKPYSGKSNSTYYNGDSNLYHSCGNSQYGKVSVSYDITWNGLEYTYTCANCDEFGVSNGRNTVPNFSGTLYQQGTAYQYTFSYENLGGTAETVTVLDSEKVPSTSNWDIYLAEAGGEEPRLDALVRAVTTFTKEVAEKALGDDGEANTDDDVDHRIAIVGFSSSGYDNTEILTGCSITTANKINGGTSYYPSGKAKNGVQYNTNSDSYKEACGKALVAPGSQSVKDAIDALTAHGGTQTQNGVSMAADIFAKYPLKADEQRNRVVIVFTDGVPGQSGYDPNVATSAINTANTLKKAVSAGGYGASVYTVGIFDGADATSAGSSSGTDTQKANYFMQRLSSNTEYPQTPSYYLSASDSNALSNIFKAISDNIVSGGSSIKLDEKAVVKDVITDQFDLPANAATDGIKVYTAEYGENGFGTPVQITDTEEMVSVSGRSVSVTGFDFAENWVGQDTDKDGNKTNRGKKLIIEIPIKVRKGFLGGNGVLTNAAGSGVYENADANTSLEDFESPDVDVKIKPITITAPNYNVYLTGGVPSATLIAGLTVKSGNVVLNMDPNAVNYGLEPWQNAYVEIDDLGLNGSGTGLEKDATYKATVTISPLPGTTGAAVAQSNSGSGNIKVFKPYVTVTATDIWSDYGVNVDLTKWGLATENSDTLAMTTEWKDSAGQLSTAEGVKMTGDAPAIEEATFTFDIGTDGIYKTTEANVDVNVTGMTCTVGSVDYTVPADALTVTQVGASDDHDFTIHINHFTMTITKDVGDSKEIYHQDFIFDVVSETGEKFQVVIHGKGEKTIKGLVCGKTYDVYENGEWSWRYSAVSNEGKVEKNVTFHNDPNVSNTKPNTGNKRVAFQNKQNIFTWLSGNDFLNNRKKREEV